MGAVMRILAIVITYEPDTILLTDVLRSVTPQVDGVVVIDNGSGEIDEIARIAGGLGAQVIRNPTNIGLAAAQNAGLAFAKAQAYSHVVLLDQDTIFGPDVIGELSRQLTELMHQGRNVGVIGPAYFELHRRELTKAYRAAGLQISRIALEHEAAPVRTDFVIASGSLIPLEIVEKVGTFEEPLFIDLVDVHWCLKARSVGFEAYISPTARVDHHLGNRVVRLAHRTVAVHSPFRNYYWVRNALWLARQPYTPLAWRLYFWLRILGFLAAYSTAVDQRFLRLKLMKRGVWDGLKGRLGPLRLD